MTGSALIGAHKGIKKWSTGNHCLRDLQTLCSFHKALQPSITYLCIVANYTIKDYCKYKISIHLKKFPGQTIQFTLPFCTWLWTKSFWSQEFIWIVSFSTKLTLQDFTFQLIDTFCWKKAKKKQNNVKHFNFCKYIFLSYIYLAGKCDATTSPDIEHDINRTFPLEWSYMCKTQSLILCKNFI